MKQHCHTDARSSYSTVFMAVVSAAVLLFTSTLQQANAYSADDTPHKKHHVHHHAQTLVGRPQPASFIVDAKSGKILVSENADALRYPASLTKMMTLYLTFEALNKGKLKLDQTIPISERAAGQPQTNIALKAGDSIAVKDAIMSIVVRSANDSAVALGEALGGSESAFAQKMTKTAHTLGMKNTEFHNASGLPEPAQHTSAHDMAILGLALSKHFPQYFTFFKTQSFTYKGTTYVTHNHVMVRYDGVDGIKTGYIRASGFNVVTSAHRDGHHLIAVVMGGPTWKARDDKMIALLDKTFSQLADGDAKKNKKQAARMTTNTDTTQEAALTLPQELAAVEAAMGEGDRAQEEVVAASPKPEVAKHTFPPGRE